MKVVYSIVPRMAHKIKVVVTPNGFTVTQNKIGEDLSNHYNQSELENNTFETDVLFDDVKARADLADHTCYNIFEGDKGLFNMYANSKTAKLSGQEFAQFHSNNSAICLVIPFKNSPVEDWVLSINVFKDTPEFFELIGATGTEMLINHCGHSASREDNLPLIHFNNEAVSGNTNDVLELPFTVKNADGTTASIEAEVYFETTGGFLPVTRKVVLGNGIAFISLRDIPSGERFKVKAGFKNFTGISECQITVN